MNTALSWPTAEPACDTLVAACHKNVAASSTAQHWPDKLLQSDTVAWLWRRLPVCLVYGAGFKSRVYAALSRLASWEVGALLLAYHLAKQLQEACHIAAAVLLPFSSIQHQGDAR